MCALESSLAKSVENAKLFVVGAGGIGCELLKNLVLTGFRNIQVIDLDTIDVSNLNRQFLFQKKHVGLSKSQVAKDSVLHLCPTANIKAIHDSIFNPEYNMQFFKQFDLVLNALDNRAARSHVNRMCLASSIPLIESGSAGYLGQVTVIKKGMTECYECTPAPRQKTFPGCTIRNTPSELIHCIVWAKYLFNQLFGEEDADQDVSPDTEDPEAKTPDSTAGGDANQSDGPFLQRKSTREWARESNYDPCAIFDKLFNTDIKYLLSMDKLWEKRKAPVPLSWDSTGATSCASVLQTSTFQQVLSVEENARLFAASLASLKAQLQSEGDGGMLVWDKDDIHAMNFVSTAANIRAHIFDIAQKSGFEVKSMAGNIIPAIATTNAIVAGLIVIQALRIINKEFEKCKSVFVCKAANATKKLLIPCSLDPPKPDCYVCAEKPEITIKFDTSKLLVSEFRDKILKQKMGMLAPDVEILDGRASILISSDEDDNDENHLKRPLSDFGIRHGSRLRADDFLQNYDIVVNVLHSSDFEAEQLFEVVAKSGNFSAKKEVVAAIDSSIDQPCTSKSTNDNDDNDDVIIMDEDVEMQFEGSRKRKNVDNGFNEIPSKKIKQSATSLENNNYSKNDVIQLD